MDKNTPQWGCNLRELMKLFDMDVNQLAERAGVSRQTVYNWLSDPQRSLTAKTAANLQSIFGVPYYKIFPLEVEHDNDTQRA